MKYFDIKKLLGDTKKVLIISGCGILLISNIVLFAYLSTSMLLPSFVSIIISNLISIIITFAIYKPINKIIEEEVQTRLNEDVSAQKQLLEEKNELELQNKFLEQTAEKKEAEISRLKSELETAKQYKSISSNANSILKLEQMEYEKEGYIVKEEYVRDNMYGTDIKKDNKYLLQLNDKGEQKVLYIKKYHEKALIGIDLAKIRFCRHNNQIYLEGIRVENLHPEMTVPTEEAINYCLILNSENGEVLGLNKAKKYDDFKQWYQKQQDEMFQIDFKSEVTQLCASYTNVIRHNLANKFPSIEFVDNKIENVIDLENEPIYQLNISQDFDILEVSSSIVMIANTINQTMPIASRKRS